MPSVDAGLRGNTDIDNGERTRLKLSGLSGGTESSYLNKGFAVLAKNNKRSRGRKRRPQLEENFSGIESWSGDNKTLTDVVTEPMADGCRRRFTELSSNASLSLVFKQPLFLLAFRVLLEARKFRFQKRRN
mmetsp:Transcript_79072/g.154640  ORF Transcript_79072/g.154640 Transcript_79072/m.154640 type:complete len:131 (+) Transcript_79072:271-663(+)